MFFECFLSYLVPYMVYVVGVALNHHVQDHNGSACHVFQTVDGVFGYLVATLSYVGTRPGAVRPIHVSMVLTGGFKQFSTVSEC